MKLATNFATASYQEIVDISTVPNSVGIFGIHTPDTMKPVQMLEGFYRQFRQVRYLGCDVKVQPAATLPMEPLGVSYEAGEVTTDPRDLLNPIMVKGCHGETINRALDVAYRDNQNIGDSFTRTDYTITEGIDGGSPIYYSALSDPSFRKYGVLQPFRLGNLHPLVHKIVGTMPIYPKQSAQNWQTPFRGVDADDSLDADSEIGYYTDPTPSAGINSQLQIGAGPRTRIGAGSESQLIDGTIFTSKMEKLGWLDTVSRPQADEITVTGTVASSMVTFNKLKTDYPLDDFGYKFNTIPRLFMSLMIMPPCYKTILTFRVVLNHKFAFRGFSTARRGNLIEDAYSSDLADVASVSTTSIDTINGTTAPVTDGVY